MLVVLRGQTASNIRERGGRRKQHTSRSLKAIARRIESIDFARVRANCTTYSLHDRPAKLPGRTPEAF